MDRCQATETGSVAGHEHIPSSIIEQISRS